LDELIPNPAKEKTTVTPSPESKDSKRPARRTSMSDKREGEVEQVERNAASHYGLYDSVWTNIDRIHVVLPLDELIACLEQNFVSVDCGKPSSHVIKYLTIGIATSLNFFCDCGRSF
jgi:hypothetical protein